MRVFDGGIVLRHLSDVCCGHGNYLDKRHELGLNDRSDLLILSLMFFKWEG